MLLALQYGQHGNLMAQFLRPALMQLAIELEALNLPVLPLLTIAEFVLPLDCASRASASENRNDEGDRSFSFATQWAIVKFVREKKIEFYGARA